MKTAKSRRPVRPSRRYESPKETKEAIARIHGCFEQAKTKLRAERVKAASPEGMLRSTLQTLLKARKTIAVTRRELDQAIVALRRRLPRH